MLLLGFAFCESSALKRKLEQQLLVANYHTDIEKFMQALIVIILLTISD